MKKTIAIFISLIIVLVVAWSGFFALKEINKIKPSDSQPKIYPARLYLGNFDNKKELNDWQILDSQGANDAPSKWEISKGLLVQKSNIWKKDSIYSGSFAILKNADSWQNYEVDLKFNPVNSGGVGFIIHYQDEKNFYEVFLVNDEKLGGPFIRIDKIKDGKLQTLYQVNKSYKLKQDNKVKIVIRGSRIDFYLNSDEATLYGVDKGTPISSGSFGLMVFKMPDIKFDDLEIINLNPSNSQSENGQVLSGQTESGQSEEKQLDKQIEDLLQEIGE